MLGDSVGVSAPDSAGSGANDAVAVGSGVGVAEADAACSALMRFCSAWVFRRDTIWCASFRSFAVIELRSRVRVWSESCEVEISVFSTTCERRIGPSACGIPLYTATVPSLSPT